MCSPPRLTSVCSPTAHPALAGIHAFALKTGSPELALFEDHQAQLEQKLEQLHELVELKAIDGLLRDEDPPLPSPKAQVEADALLAARLEAKYARGAAEGGGRGGRGGAGGAGGAGGGIDEDDDDDEDDEDE